MVAAYPVTPEQAEHAILERRGIEPVPPTLRYGAAFSQFRIWFGANAVVSSLFIGALGPTVFGLSFWSSLTSILFGTAVAALAIGFLSALGPRTGMVQILFSRFVFGAWVGRFFGLFNAFYCYAWSAVNLVTGTAAIRLAFALMGLSALSTGNGSYALWVIVIAAITVVVSALGYNLVHGWEKWSTYASIVVFAVITIAILANSPHAGHTTYSGADYWKNWFGMALVSFGFGIGWVPYVSDYSRKLPETVSASAVALYAALGLTLSAVWVESLGALIMTTSGLTDDTKVVNGIASIIGNNGLVVLGMLIIGLSTVSNNIPNDYTGGLSIQAAGIHVERWMVTVVGGVISALGALFFLQDFASKLQEFLLLLAYWVGAWFVLVAYNYAKRRGRYNVAGWDESNALPTGITPTIAFIAALIAAWIGMFPGPDVSWNVLGQGRVGTDIGVDFGFILAICTALVVQIVLDLVIPEERTTA
jgi:NCS1 nucleoside transporter family